MNGERIKQKIMQLTRDYYDVVHKEKQFKPGSDYINYAGRVYDDEEMVNLVDSSLEFWLTAGRYAREFEKNLAEFLGVTRSTVYSLIDKEDLKCPEGMRAQSEFKRGKDGVTRILGPSVMMYVFGEDVLEVFEHTSFKKLLQAAHSSRAAA